MSTVAAQTIMPVEAAGIVCDYRAVRAATEGLCRTLVTEDFVVQSMPDVSPAKWHLAHTTWFFETFILSERVAGYRPFDPAFKFLFNSYYVTLGDRHCRQNRGQLSRPTVQQVYQYRRHVDDAMTDFLAGLSPAASEDLRPLLEIGLHHEQQHQELMVTDLKHVFWVNPLRPAFVPKPPGADSHGPAVPMTWIGFDGGLKSIGHDGPGFCFDNEGPRHKVWLEPFQIGSRPVTNGEYKNFIADGGYTRPDLWLSAGIATAKAEDWNAPLYWIFQDGRWMNHTAWGLLPVADDEPVCHVSFFEADAFARWAGARLATEAEWEAASESVAIEGNFAESERYHPAVADRAGLRQMFGDVWEWTSSAYLGYPGYRPPPGAIGEYNGKFMCNQFVLRGGSCATPRSHIRRTYRNFFPPDARWQFSGIRLARGI